MSLARRTQDRILAMKAASAPASGSGHRVAAAISHAAATPVPPARTAVPASDAPIDPAVPLAARQMLLRLRHDLRRLKDTRAVDRKIAAKREMLPDYAAWVDAELAAGACTVGDALPPSPAPDILPTVMVWSIDTGDWPRALAVAQHLIRFGRAMPARYERDAATLLVEETAEAALAAQLRGQAFPLDVLEEVEAITAGLDMHDQPRAKLLKALGHAHAALAEAPDAATTHATTALARFREAHRLHDRIGVRTEIRRLEKATGAAPDSAPPLADLPAGGVA